MHAFYVAGKYSHKRNTRNTRVRCVYIGESSFNETMMRESTLHNRYCI